MRGSWDDRPIGAACSRASWIQKLGLGRLHADITLRNPAIANERLALTRQGNVRYRLKTPYRDGTTHVVLEPLGEPKPKWLNVTSQFGERPAMDGRAGGEKH